MFRLFDPCSKLLYHLIPLQSLRSNFLRVSWDVVSQTWGPNNSHQINITLNFNVGFIFIFSLHAEYIIRNDGLDKPQAEIKIAEKNISNLRYKDDTTLMAESAEELKASWLKWKRRVKKWA